MKTGTKLQRMLRQAWAFKWEVLAAGFGAAEVALPLFSDAVPKYLFLALSMFIGVGSACARIIVKLREAKSAKAAQ